MNCPKCDKPVRDGVKFCPECGAKIPKDTPSRRIGAIALDATAGRNIISIGSSGLPAGAVGDYCPICGAFNPPEKTFRCVHCGREYICREHRDTRTRWCSECAAETALVSQEAEPLAAAPPAAAGSSEPEAGTTRLLEKAGITLVYVPAGDFWMGAADDDADARGDEKPQHKVHVDGFWIAQTAVTNVQYRRFIEGGGYTRREHWTDEGWRWKEGVGYTRPRWWDQKEWNQPGLPAVGVSWYEADAFARWAGGRLPTEAEWEYAARGGPLSKGYRYAGSNDVREVAWYEDNSDERAHPVEQKRPNELGLYDMSGNVREWCQDWYGAEYYRWSVENNPPGPPSGEYRVLRGGSWFFNQRGARCTDRNWKAPLARYSSNGFRVVLLAS